MSKKSPPKPPKLPPKPVKGPVKPPVKRPPAAVPVGQQEVVKELKDEWLIAEDDLGDIKDYQREKVRIEANIRALQLAQMQRQLVPVNVVRELKLNASITFRDSWFAMIDRSAAELAALTDPRMVREYLHQSYGPLLQMVEEGWLPPEYDKEAVA